MQENNNYKEVLTREGVKSTKHRNSILKILEQAEMPLTVEEIFLLSFLDCPVDEIQKALKDKINFDVTGIMHHIASQGLQAA